MTRFALALACFLVLAGCGGDLHGKMVGDWKVDADYMKNMDEYKNASAEEKGMLDMMAGSMQLSITDDTLEMKMSFMGKEDSKKASYVVKSQDGDTLTIETTDEDGKKETGKVRFDGDTMVIEVDDKPLALQKK